MTELEREGVELLKKYGMLVKMNGALCAFLRKVAVRLEWAEFGSML